MAGLDAVRGGELIGRRLAGGRPVLGICVGMQVLFDRGVERGTDTEGLGEWPGVVDELDAPVLPHIGWNTVEAPEDSRAVRRASRDERFYFVHSYAARDWTLEATGAFAPPRSPGREHGERFVAAAENGPLSATQFHPEKSGEAGIRLLAQLARHPLSTAYDRLLVTEFNTRPPLTLLPAVDVADGKAVRLTQGEAGTETSYGDPSRPRRPVVEPGRRVDPPRRPRRRVRSRQQPRDHQARSSRTPRAGCNIELSGGIRDDASLDAALATGREAHQPGHRGPREPRVGRARDRRVRRRDRRRPRRARHDARRARLDPGGRRPLGGARPPRGGRLRPLRRHRRHEGRHAAGPEPRPAAAGDGAHAASRSSPPAASPTSTTSPRCANWCRTGSRARSSARRSTPARSPSPRRSTSPGDDRDRDSAGVPWEGRVVPRESRRRRRRHRAAAVIEAIRRFRAGELGVADVVEALHDARLLLPLLADARRRGRRRARPARRQDPGAQPRHRRRAPTAGPCCPPSPRSTRCASGTRPRGRSRSPCPRIALAVAAEGTPLIVIDPGHADHVRGAPSGLPRRSRPGTPWIPSFEDPEVLQAFLDASASEPDLVALQLAPGDPAARLAGAELLVQLSVRDGLPPDELDALVARLGAALVRRPDRSPSASTRSAW